MTEKAEKTTKQLSEQLEKAKEEIRWKAWHIETVTNFITKLWEEENYTLKKDAIDTGDLLTSMNLINQEAKAIIKLTDEIESLEWAIKK